MPTESCLRLACLQLRIVCLLLALVDSGIPSTRLRQNQNKIQTKKIRGSQRKVGFHLYVEEMPAITLPVTTLALAERLWTCATWLGLDTGKDKPLEKRKVPDL